MARSYKNQAHAGFPQERTMPATLWVGIHADRCV